MMTPLQEAAQRAMDTHDTLAKAWEDEPDLDEDGVPFDDEAWLDWKADVATPAYASWDEAMIELARLTGPEDFPGRHPWNFLPYCEKIVAS